jgi:hypothetical protein
MLSLNAQAWLSLVALAVVMGLLLFISAGTIHYWQAWVYLAIFMGTSVLTTLYLMKMTWRFAPHEEGQLLKSGKQKLIMPVPQSASLPFLSSLRSTIVWYLQCRPP